MSHPNAVPGREEVNPASPATQPKLFACSICGESSTSICVYCTKDACSNHLCAKCARCSDCCECEVARDAAPRGTEPAR